MVGWVCRASYALGEVPPKSKSFKTDRCSPDIIGILTRKHRVACPDNCALPRKKRYGFASLGGKRIKFAGDLAHGRRLIPLNPRLYPLKHAPVSHWLPN